jgi:hypothetical protein
MVDPYSANRRSPRFAALALILALVGAGSMLYYQFGLFLPRVQRASAARHLAGEYSFGNDLFPIWLTSRRWLHDGLDPYGPVLTREIQIGLFGRPLDSQFPTDPPNDYRRFAYPAFTDLLLWPVSEIPFRTLRAAWVALLAALLATAVVFWARALSWHLSRTSLVLVLLLTLCSYPELEGFYAGQPGLLVGFLLAASLLALVRNRPLLAGTLMALATIKPQMVLLAIVYLFLWTANDWRRRGAFTLAFLATMSLLIAAPLAILPRWIQSWASVIQGYPRYSKPPLASELLGSTLGSHIGRPAIAILLIAALWLAWRGRAAAIGSYEFWLTLSIQLSITVVALLPGQAVHDHVILLPGIFLLTCRWEEWSSSWILRALLVGLAVLIVVPWFASLILIVLRPLLTDEQFYSKGVFALPLRTAAAFPFVVLGALFLALRRIPPDGKQASLPG